MTSEKSSKSRKVRFLDGGRTRMVMTEIRTRFATGDTMMHERSAMMKRPAHILVTTARVDSTFCDRRKSRAISARCRNTIVAKTLVEDDKRGDTSGALD